MGRRTENSKESPLSIAFCLKKECISLKNESGSMIAFSILILPASNFEKSRISFTIPNSVPEANCIILTYSVFLGKLPPF